MPIRNIPLARESAMTPQEAPPRLACARRARAPLGLAPRLLALPALGDLPDARGQEEPLPPPEAVLPPMGVEAPPALSSSSEVLIPGKSFELRPQGRPADILRL